MKLRYGYAIVSFCPDLTNPLLPSIPIAGLTLGEIESEKIAVTAIIRPADDFFADDPITCAIVNDLPAVLSEHVNDAFEKSKNDPMPIDAVLRRLQNALRNSLHVSSMSTSIETDVADEMMTASPLVDELLRQMLTATRATKEALSKIQPESAKRRLPTGSKQPELRSWSLPSARVPQTEQHATGE